MTYNGGQFLHSQRSPGVGTTDRPALVPSARCIAWKAPARVAGVRPTKLSPAGDGGGAAARPGPVTGGPARWRPAGAPERLRQFRRRLAQFELTAVDEALNSGLADHPHEMGVPSSESHEGDHQFRELRRRSSRSSVPIRWARARSTGPPFRPRPHPSPSLRTATAGADTEGPLGMSYAATAPALCGGVNSTRGVRLVHIDLEQVGLGHVDGLM